jgi:hypothetical protein
MKMITKVKTIKWLEEYCVTQLDAHLLVRYIAVKKTHLIIFIAALPPVLQHQIKVK